MNINLLQGQRVMALRQRAETDSSTYRVDDWVPAKITLVYSAVVRVEYDDGQNEFLPFADVAVVLTDLADLDLTKPQNEN